MTTIHAALNAVMRDVQAVRKGEKNTHGNFLFRGIEQTVATKGGLTCENRVESKQPRRCWTHRTGPDHTPCLGRRWLS